MQNTIYVLIHSPLVGGLTWTFVADQMQQRGLEVIVPTLHDSSDSKEPYWKQHANSISQALGDIQKDTALTLVAHSGAGPLLPVIRQSIPNPIHAYVFVDAGIPRDGATRLGLMKSEDSNWAQEFQVYLEGGGRFPIGAATICVKLSWMKTYASSWLQNFILARWISLQSLFPYLMAGPMRRVFIFFSVLPIKGHLFKREKQAGQPMNGMPVTFTCWLMQKQ